MFKRFERFVHRYFWPLILTMSLITVALVCNGAWAGEKEELTLKRELIVEKANRLQLQQTLIQREFAELQAALKDVDEKLKKYAPKKEEKKK